MLLLSECLKNKKEQTTSSDQQQEQLSIQPQESKGYHKSKLSLGLTQLDPSMLPAFCYEITATHWKVPGEKYIGEINLTENDWELVTMMLNDDPSNPPRLSCELCKHIYDKYVQLVIVLYIPVSVVLS